MKNQFRKFLSLLMAVTMLMSVFSASMSVFAAGSKELNLKSDNNTGKRFFSEHLIDGTTAGMNRRTVIKCYLNKGETACFGSSVFDSKIDINERNASRITNADIVVQNPDGTKTPFDVIEGGEGYISRRVQELNGPITPESDKKYPEYYQPLSFVAQEDGIYVFNFHSQVGTTKTPLNTADLNDDFAALKGQATSDVAFWDITVLDTDYNEIGGRIWADYLALSTGSAETNTKANLEVYVLTNDGYIYRVHFKDIVPFGFIFFANNQGFTTTGKTPYSIYHSFYDDDNNLKNMVSKELITLHKPYMTDTELAHTFKIFFEYPNDDLIGKIYNEPPRIESIKDLTFHGQMNVQGTAHYGQGGYFTFVSKGATSATITIDFRDSLEEMKQNGENLNGYNGSGVVELSGAVVDGENVFYWNGKDTDDISIPIGVYGKNKIHTAAEAKGGEVHFPFIDVEGLYGGVEIERMDKNSSNSNQIDTDKFDIFYNNNPLVYQTIEGTEENGADIMPLSNNMYELTDGTKTFSVNNLGTYTNVNKYFKADSNNNLNYNSETYLSNKKISTLERDTPEYLYELEHGKGTWEKADDETKTSFEAECNDFKPTYHHEPNDSRKDTIIFSNDGNYGGGNQAGIDIWTYYSNGITDSEMKTDMQILAAEGVGKITGRVFYDNNINQKYDADGGDYALRDVEVELVDANGVPVTKTINGPKFDDDGYFVRDENGKIIYEDQVINFRTKTNRYGIYTFTGIDITKGQSTEYYVHVLLSPAQVLVEDFKLTTTSQTADGGPDGNERDSSGMSELIQDKTVYQQNNSQSVTLSEQKSEAEFKDIGYVANVPAENQMDYRVVKRWPTDGTQKLNSITVELYNWDPQHLVETETKFDEVSQSRIGELIETVFLSAANNWSYTWRHLDKNKQYYFIEYYTKTDDAGNAITNDRGEERLVLIGGTMPIYSTTQNEKYSFVLDNEVEERDKEYFGDGKTHYDATTEWEREQSPDADALQYEVSYELSRDNTTKTNTVTITNDQSYDEREYYVWLNHETELPNFVQKTNGTHVNEEGKKDIEVFDLVKGDNGFIEGMTVTTLDAKVNTDGDATDMFLFDEARPQSVKYTPTTEGDYPEGTGTRTYLVKYNDPNDGLDTEFSWKLTIHVYDVSADKYVLDYGLNAKLQESEASSDKTENYNYMVLSNDVYRVGYYKNSVPMHTCADFIGAAHSPYGLLDDESAVNELIWHDTHKENARANVAVAGKNGTLYVNLTKPRSEKTDYGDDHINHVETIFEPTSFMSDIDVFYYKVAVFGESVSNKADVDYDKINPTNGVIMYAPIIVMPASSVYYEDGERFSTTYTGNTKIDPSNRADSIYQSINQDEIYGFDSAYIDPAGSLAGQYDSLGGSTDIINKSSSFTFEFKGTGYDILGRTDSTAGKLTYRIDKMNDQGVYKLYRGGSVDASYIDSSNSSLYQLPVISIKDLDYGKYKVKITLTSTSTGSYHFNLDGIRIYNPLGPDGSAEYYLKTEAGATVKPVREMILGSLPETKIADGFVPSDATAAIIYSDSSDGNYKPGSTVTEIRSASTLVNHSEDLDDYLSAGPKGELYIPSGSGIAFRAISDGSNEDNTLQLEAKAIYDGEHKESSGGYGCLLDVRANKEIEINSSTSMYYELDTSYLSSQDNSVIIVNDSDYTVSVTNLKYKGYEISYPENINKSDLLGSTSVDCTTWTNDKTDSIDENVKVTSANFATSYARAGKDTYINVTITEPITNKAATYAPYLLDSEGNMVTLTETDLTPVRSFKTTLEDETSVMAFAYKVRVTAPNDADTMNYTVGAVKRTTAEDDQSAENTTYSSNAWKVSIIVKQADIGAEVTVTMINEAKNMRRVMLVSDEPITTADDGWVQLEDDTIIKDLSESGEFSVNITDIDGFSSMVTFTLDEIPELPDDDSENDSSTSFFARIIAFIRNILDFLKKIFNF